MEFLPETFKTNELVIKSFGGCKMYVPYARPKQTKTVSQQVIENQQVYI